MNENREKRFKQRRTVTDHLQKVPIPPLEREVKSHPDPVAPDDFRIRRCRSCRRRRSGFGLDDIPGQSGRALLTTVRSPENPTPGRARGGTCRVGV
jgi:hypothetical protein